MEHAHSSYAHIILQMSIAHWVKFKPTPKKNDAQIIHQCI